MKKLLVTAVIASLISGVAFAAANTNVVSSVNIVGYIKANELPGIQIISSPFGGGTLNDFAPTNGLGGDSLANSDNIYIFVNGAYKNYFFAGDVGDPALNYKWIDDVTSEVATNVIKAGTAVWYRNRAATTNVHTFAGDVVLNAKITNNIIEGIQLITTPYSSPATLNSLGLTNGIGGDSLANSDNIYIFVGGTYKNYFFAGDVGDPALNYKWIDDVTSEVATNEIPAGSGVWYRCRKVGGYSWVAPRPYLNN